MRSRNWSVPLAWLLIVAPSATTWAATPEALPLTETRTTYYHSDVVGNIRAESNDGGTLTGTHRYEPFGLTIPTEALSTEAPRFGGKLRDPVSGLDDFGARHFAAEYGRFLATDPIAFGSKRFSNPQDLNLYGYVLNNPFKYVDPDGRSPRGVGSMLRGGGIVTMDEYVRMNRQQRLEADDRNQRAQMLLETHPLSMAQEMTGIVGDAALNYDEYVPEYLAYQGYPGTALAAGAVLTFWGLTKNVVKAGGKAAFKIAERGAIQRIMMSVNGQKAIALFRGTASQITLPKGALVKLAGQEPLRGLERTVGLVNGVITKEGDVLLGLTREQLDTLRSSANFDEHFQDYFSISVNLQSGNIGGAMGAPGRDALHGLSALKVIEQ